MSWFLPDQASKDLHRVDDNNNNPSNSNHHDAASTEHSRTKATAEDTDRRDQVVIDRFWKVHQRLSGPFASPLTYPHLAQLADIQLHLVGSHICPLLDDAIQMYQKWAGPRSLLMFDDLPHGFIQFVDQCKESRKATARIGEMIALILSQPNRNENPAYPVLKVNSQSVPVDPVISLIRAN